MLVPTSIAEALERATRALRRVFTLVVHAQDFPVCTQRRVAPSEPLAMGVLQLSKT